MSTIEATNKPLDDGIHAQSSGENKEETKEVLHVSWQKPIEMEKVPGQSDPYPLMSPTAKLWLGDTKDAVPQKYLNIYIDKTDKLIEDPNLTRPVLRVHLIDYKSGKYWPLAEGPTGLLRLAVIVRRSRT